MPSFRCEHCRQRIAARDAHAGRRVRCPRCKQAVRVPKAEADPAPPAGAPAPDHLEPASPLPKVPIVVPKPPVIVPEPAPAFTRPPPKDFSAIFSAPLDELFEPAAHDYSPEEQTQVLRPVHPRQEPPHPHPGAAMDFPAEQSAAVDHEPAPPPEPSPVVVEPAEIIDAPAPMRAGLNSVNEVADLLRGLDNPAQRARLAAASAAADAEARRRVIASSRPARLMGWASLFMGLAAIGLTCLPAVARYAVPVGAGGLLVAMSGLLIGISRRAGIALSAGGAIASAAGVGVALLWGFGLLPFKQWAAARRGSNAPPVTLVAATQPDQPPGTGEYVPASSPVIVDNVEVRVVSARVLRPAVYAGDLDSLHTASDPRLQITLELKNLGSSPANYLPWRQDGGGEDPVRLSEADGAMLPLEEMASSGPGKPFVLAAAALTGPVALGRVPVVDVLLFGPPDGAFGDLKLDLPGRNIGRPGITLHIRIPRSLVRVQGTIAG